MSKADVVNEIYKNARLNFPRRHVIMKDIDDLWQADLIEYTIYFFSFAVIDTFSKYALTFALKNRTKDVVCNSFKILFEKGGIPKNLQTDDGTELYNNKFKIL